MKLLEASGQCWNYWSDDEEANEDDSLPLVSDDSNNSLDAGDKDPSGSFQRVSAPKSQPDDLSLHFAEPEMEPTA